MKTSLTVILMLSLFATPAIAESIKTDSIKPAICESGAADIIYLVPGNGYEISGENRLPAYGARHKYVFYIGEMSQDEANKLKVSFIETRRKTRIEEDLSKLGEIIKDSSKLFEVLNAETKQKYCITYSSVFKHSNIAISVDTEPKISRSFIAGEAEHWYLSADMPVSNIKQLSYDPKTSTLVEKDKPASFYLGLNYKIGDVYTGYDQVYSNNISLKFLFHASGTPTESMGLGAGYNFDFAEVFVAKIWTADHESAGQTTLGTTQSWVAGVSFNIAKAVSWLKE